MAKKTDLQETVEKKKKQFKQEIDVLESLLTFCLGFLLFVVHKYFLKSTVLQSRCTQTCQIPFSLSPKEFFPKLDPGFIVVLRFFPNSQNTKGKNPPWFLHFNNKYLNITKYHLPKFTGAIFGTSRDVMLLKQRQKYFQTRQLFTMAVIKPMILTVLSKKKVSFLVISFIHCYFRSYPVAAGAFKP